MVCSSREQDTEGVVRERGGSWETAVLGLGQRPRPLCSPAPSAQGGKIPAPGRPPSVPGIPQRRSACVPRHDPGSFGVSFDLASPSGLSCQGTKSLSAPGHTPACTSLHSGLGCGLLSLFCGAAPRPPACSLTGHAPGVGAELGPPSRGRRLPRALASARQVMSVCWDPVQSIIWCE